MEELGRTRNEMKQNREMRKPQNKQAEDESTEESETGRKKIKNTQRRADAIGRESRTPVVEMMTD